MEQLKRLQTWQKIAEYARMSPSPHNTQPLRIKPISTLKAEVYYDLSRGLPEGDPPARFAHTAVGIFVECIKIAAADLGYELVYSYNYDQLKTKQLKGMQRVADLELKKNSGIKDLSADLILKRHTNRLPYTQQKISRSAVAEIQKEAEKYGHKFYLRTDKKAVDWVNELNKRMVFYDLDEDNVRSELAGWSRFTKHQAEATKDGLSAECLHVPGWGLWLFMKHYGFLKVPGLRSLLQGIYWRNMQGIENIAWIEGPFFNTKEYVLSGHVLFRIWLLMAKYNIAYQPFGSVITNAHAHQEFTHFLDIHETENMAWLLMRIGYASSPPHSKRLPVSEILI